MTRTDVPKRLPPERPDGTLDMDKELRKGFIVPSGMDTYVARSWMRAL
jgi:hypothetical protein